MKLLSFQIFSHDYVMATGIYYLQRTPSSPPDRIVDRCRTDFSPCTTILFAKFSLKKHGFIMHGIRAMGIKKEVNSTTNTRGYPVPKSYGDIGLRQAQALCVFDQGVDSLEFIASRKVPTANVSCSAELQAVLRRGHEAKVLVDQSLF